jgi:hypothetical protein
MSYETRMEETRMECLRLAVQKNSCRRSDQILDDAQQFFKFVAGIEHDVVGAAIVANEREIAGKAWDKQ